MEARKERAEKRRKDSAKHNLSEALLRGYKKQSRYVPGVAMSREELSAWRKEARRIRNRESAAASREKTRQRIEELEEQLEEMKQKYNDAMDRIAQLQGQEEVSTSREPLAQTLISPESTPPQSHVSTESIPDSFSLEDDDTHSQSMISASTAVR